MLRGRPRRHGDIAYGDCELDALEQFGSDSCGCSADGREEAASHRGQLGEQSTACDLCALALRARGWRLAEVAPDLTKTTLCEAWLGGTSSLCPEQCPYAHGDEEHAFRAASLDVRDHLLESFNDTYAWYAEKGVPLGPKP